MSSDERERSLKRFLLGLASESESDSLEAELFARDEAFEELLAAEVELFDAYASGSLSAVEGDRFERRFLRLPANRLRLGVAVALSEVTREEAGGVVGTVAAGVAQAATTSPRPPRKAPALPARWRALRIPLLGGAVVLALLLAGGLALENQRLAQTLGRLSGERGELERRLSTLESQLAQERAALHALSLRSTERERELRRAMALDSEPGESGDRLRGASESMVGLLLRPGSLRPGAEAPELVLSPGVQWIRVGLLLEFDDYPLYRVLLERSGGEPFWQRDRVPSQAFRTGRGVGFQLPAKLLSPGPHLFALQGFPPDGPAETVAEYWFQAAPP